MTTVNKEEIQKFSLMADEWWDVNGKFKPLHMFNPTRIEYITENIKNHFDNMVLTRLYVDKKDSLSSVYAQMQFERYKTATQPYYVVLDPSNESTLVDTGGYIPNGFDKFLSRGLEKFNSKNMD